MSKKNIFNKITTALAISTALSLAFMVDLPKAKAFSLIQEDLFLDAILLEVKRYPRESFRLLLMV
jgi:hypothetical protein